MNVRYVHIHQGDLSIFKWRSDAPGNPGIQTTISGTGFSLTAGNYIDFPNGVNARVIAIPWPS